MKQWLKLEIEATIPRPHATKKEAERFAPLEWRRRVSGTLGDEPVAGLRIF